MVDQAITSRSLHEKNLKEVVVPKNPTHAQDGSLFQEKELRDLWLKRRRETEKEKMFTTGRVHLRRSNAGDVS